MAAKRKINKKFNRFSAADKKAAHVQPLHKIRINRILSKNDDYSVCDLPDRVLCIPHKVSPGLAAISADQRDFPLRVHTAFLIDAGVLQFGHFKHITHF